jgi:hypothetical protein
VIKHNLNKLFTVWMILANLKGFEAKGKEERKREEEEETKEQMEDAGEEALCPPAGPASEDKRPHHGGMDPRLQSGTKVLSNIGLQKFLGKRLHHGGITMGVGTVQYISCCSTEGLH